jgi:hypothetical protein
MPGVFGNDDYFGVTWSLLHLIETAPHVPVDEQPARGILRPPCFWEALW